MRSARVVAAVPLGPLPAGGRTPDPMTGGGQGVARAGLIEPVSGAGAAFGLDLTAARSARRELRAPRTEAALPSGG